MYLSNIYLQVIKDKKVFKKEFKKKIIFNSALFVLSILFVVKFNKKLYFYINYRELNILIKYNRYSIFLIKKTLIRIINCKYLTKLNIIATFNKLRIYSKSKEFTIFVIFIEIDKYYIYFFELINSFASYQYYINNISFEYLYNFC